MSDVEVWLVPEVFKYLLLGIAMREYLNIQEVNTLFRSNRCDQPENESRENCCYQ